MKPPCPGSRCVWTKGIAARLSARLLKRFGSPEDVFRGSLKQLEACELPAATAQAVAKKEAFRRAEKELAALRAIPGAHLINWTEPEFPQTWLQIYDPPVLLYVRGDSQILNAPSLAMVGTRRPTLYGTQMADRLARELAARGIVIVSGLARGIDAIAHQGALAVQGRAVGVLGTGIDVVYPKENKKLYEKVLERGAILSEFPLRRTPPPKIFPYTTASWPACPSALSSSKARSTPALSSPPAWPWSSAAKSSAFPCNVTQAVSFAPNLLIKQGVKLVTNAEDVIEELPTPVRAALTRPDQPETAQRNLLISASLTGSGQKIYATLSSDEPRPIDESSKTPA